MFTMKKKPKPTYEELQEAISGLADEKAERVRHLKDDLGLTFEDIGKNYFNPPISRQRVEQLYKRAKGR